MVYVLPLLREWRFGRSDVARRVGTERLDEVGSVRPRGNRGGGLAVVRLVVTVAALMLDLLVWSGQTQSWVGVDLPLPVMVAAIVVAYSTIVVFASPVPGYIAMVFLSATGLGMTAFEGLGGLLVSLFLVAYLVHPRGALVALFASAIPVTANAFSTDEVMEQHGTSLILTTTALWVTFVLVSWGAGRLRARNEQRLATERRWASEARADALVTERLRISRELHDSVAHALAGIVLQAAGARAGLKRSSVSTEQLDLALGSIQDASEQSIREMHRLVGLLREDQPQEGPLAGIEEIPGLVESSRASGFDVVMGTEGDPFPIDPSIGRTAYRVVQEGLSNAMRHGHPGTRVGVRVEWAPRQLTVSVRNGAGLGVGSVAQDEQVSLPSGGFGIIGLRERVAVLGGTLESGPDGNSYLLRASMPLGEEAPASPVVPTTEEQK